MVSMESMLRRLSKCGTTIDVTYVIVGGIAVIIYGRPRFTQDIDVIIEYNREKLTQFLALLEKHDFKILSFVKRRLLEDQKRVDILDKRSVLRLELLPATGELELLSLENIRMKQYKGIDLPVVSPEMLLLGKLIYLGDISKVTQENLLKYKDVRDFCSIYSQRKAKMNMEWLKRKTERFNVAQRRKTLINLCHTL